MRRVNRDTLPAGCPADPPKCDKSAPALEHSCILLSSNIEAMMYARARLLVRCGGCVTRCVRQAPLEPATQPGRWARQDYEARR